jgi:hypothetical protein
MVKQKNDIYLKIKKSRMFIAIFILLLVVVVLVGLVIINKDSEIQISSFAECAEAGYPIQESFPERCVTPGGQTFVNR